jgi:hypothetical protein
MARGMIPPLPEAGGGWRRGLPTARGAGARAGRICRLSSLAAGLPTAAVWGRAGRRPFALQAASALTALRFW